MIIFVTLQKIVEAMEADLGAEKLKDNQAFQDLKKKALAMSKLKPFSLTKVVNHKGKHPIIHELDERYPDLELKYWTGLEDSIVGVADRCSMPTVVVHDFDKMKKIFMERDGMTEEDAEEWISFNITGAWIGDTTPITLYDWQYKMTRDEAVTKIEVALMCTGKNQKDANTIAKDIASLLGWTEAGK